MLDKNDIRYMKEQATALTRISQAEIRYKQAIDDSTTGSGGYDYGSENYSYNSEEYSWSEWQTFRCATDKIDSHNINDYDYGNIAEGDFILLLPRDTSLIKEADEYEFKIGGNIYTAKTELQEMGFVDNTFLYYVLAGGLKDD